MKDTSNWSFDEVVEFLTLNGFIEIKVDSSHHIFKGVVNDITTLVEVQYHANVHGMIKPGTLRDGIIVQSRIPAAEWRKYARMSTTMRKKYRYAGCLPLTAVAVKKQKR